MDSDIYVFKPPSYRKIMEFLTRKIELCLSCMEYHIEDKKEIQE